jgi:hypothetical protein
MSPVTQTWRVVTFSPRLRGLETRLNLHTFGNFSPFAGRPAAAKKVDEAATD